ncbi:hypothetical protein EV715DRAFT_214510 [Schizophyllum commune]
MRMRKATPDDRAMAKALSNMRYASCTPEDLDFLQSRIVGSSPTAPTLSDPLFRNASIITARNAEKDAFNELGARRFAADTGQELVSFYSSDSRAAEDTVRSKSKKKQRRKKVATASSGISDDVQKLIWASLPCFTGNVAGRLDLCKGMPVMIRSNIATELCMTKGQEAVVYDWTASMGSRKQRILDVLYVKLINPPTPVHIEGLEENVVPLTKARETVECQLPNDQIVKIDRLQVPVLQNFSMTDYASQGKTRPVNVVNLTNSRSHQAYYTALSRSSSAAATAIVSSFNTSMITRGLDDQLKREFRNLEILSEITRLKYEGKLPTQVTGDTRNQLIRSFLDWMGPDYEIPNLHHALKWQSADDFDDVDAPFGRQAWQMVENEEESPDSEDSSKATTVTSTKAGTKRKRTELAENESISAAINPPKEKRARTENTSIDATTSPRGYSWDSENWSCPYDSLFTVLHCIWSHDPAKWTPIFAGCSEFARDLASKWSEYREGGSISWKDTRDTVRRKVHDKDPALFPNGQRPAPVARLALEILGSTTFATRAMKCVRCGSIRNEGREILTQCHPLYTTNLLNGRRSERFTTANWVSEVLKGSCRALSCLSCKTRMIPLVTILNTPDILCLDRSDVPLIISHALSFNGSPMRLRGIVYSGESHFTCRVVDESGTVYRHDGIINGEVCEREGDLARMAPEVLGTWRSRVGGSKTASLVIYERVNQDHA